MMLEIQSMVHSSCVSINNFKKKQRRLQPTIVALNNSCISLKKMCLEKLKKLDVWFYTFLKKDLVAPKKNKVKFLTKEMHSFPQNALGVGGSSLSKSYLKCSLGQKVDKLLFDLT